MTETLEKQLKKLQSQVSHLQEMILDQGRLGLSDGRKFIYIKKEKKCLWRFIADDEPIYQKAITGYVIDFYRKEDETPKLHVVLRTQEAEYVLCSGFESHFSRDILAAIATLKPHHLRRALKIVPSSKDAPQPKQGEKTIHMPVYANVLLDDKTIKTYQMKSQYTAQQLYEMAKVVLTNSAVRTGLGDSTAIAKPKSHDDSLPPIVDWNDFLDQLGVSGNQFRAFAVSKNYPASSKDLTPEQSRKLQQLALEHFQSQ